MTKPNDIKYTGIFLKNKLNNEMIEIYNKLIYIYH